MKLRSAAFLGSILGVVAAMAPTPAANALQGDWVPQQIIVRVQPGQSIGAINQMYGTTVAGTIESVGVFLLQIPGGGDERALRARMAGDGRLAWAELNFIQVAPEGSTQSFFLARRTPGTTSRLRRGSSMLARRTS